MPPERMPRAAFWIWNVSAWVAVAVLGATQTLIAMRAQSMAVAAKQLYATQILSWTPWIFATPIVIALGRRKAPAALHVLALVAIDVTWAAVSSAVQRTLNPFAAGGVQPPFMKAWLVRAEAGVLQNVLVYAVVLAASYALDTRDRLARQDAEAARLNEQLTSARLHALQQQIEPHFLFNALHAVGGLVREGQKDTAVRAIADLSDCLRRLLRTEAQLVPLARELEFTEKYLDIQKLRFGDDLRVDVDVPTELLLLQVPSITLQPIVDNAIKHGISQRVGGGAVRIAARREDGWLALTVYNDGPPLDDRPDAGRGIGFENLGARLTMIYQGNFRLTIDNAQTGVLVALSVPVRS